MWQDMGRDSDEAVFLSPSVGPTPVQGHFGAPSAGGASDDARQNTIVIDGASAVPTPSVRRVSLCGGGTAYSSVDEHDNVQLGWDVAAGSWLRACIDDARGDTDSDVGPSAGKRPALGDAGRRDFRQGLEDVLAGLVQQEEEVRETSIATYGNACSSRMLDWRDELLSAAQDEHGVSDCVPNSEEIDRATNDVAKWVDMEAAQRYTADIEALCWRFATHTCPSCRVGNALLLRNT